MLHISFVKLKYNTTIIYYHLHIGVCDIEKKWYLDIFGDFVDNDI